VSTDETEQTMATEEDDHQNNDVDDNLLSIVDSEKKPASKF